MKIERIVTCYTEETEFKGFIRVMEKSEAAGITSTKFIALRVPKGTPYIRIYGNYTADVALFHEESIKHNCYLYIKGSVYRLNENSGSLTKSRSSCKSVATLMAFARSLESLDHAWDQLRSKGATFRKDFSGRHTYLDVEGTLFQAHCSDTFDLLFAARAITKGGKIIKRKFPVIALGNRVIAFGNRMSQVIPILKALTSAGVIK